jgi:TonB family protein
MTERDDFEDVLTRYQPSGPSASMQPPAALFANDAIRTGSSRRMWIAAGVAVVSITAGSSWWADQRSASSSFSEVGPPAEAAPVGQGTDAGTEARASAVGAEAVASGRSSRERPFRVGGDLREPKRTRYVAPVYSGDPGTGLVAIVEVLVTPEGKVDSTHVLRGQAPFAGEAAEAVREWEFQPMRIRGEAVWVVITVAVSNPPR